MKFSRNDEKTTSFWLNSISVSLQDSIFSEFSKSYIYPTFPELYFAYLTDFGMTATGFEPTTT